MYQKYFKYSIFNTYGVNHNIAFLSKATFNTYDVVNKVNMF